MENCEYFIFYLTFSREPIKLNVRPSAAFSKLTSETWETFFALYMKGKIFFEFISHPLKGETEISEKRKSWGKFALSRRSLVGENLRFTLVYRKSQFPCFPPHHRQHHILVHVFFLNHREEKMRKVCQEKSRENGKLKILLTLREWKMQEKLLLER